MVCEIGAVGEQRRMAMEIMSIRFRKPSSTRENAPYTFKELRTMYARATQKGELSVS
jgi:hypothetical protein